MKELENLAEEWADCTACPLAETRTRIVFGSGCAETAKILIIGEAPGKAEDEAGVPFVGRSGQLLTSLLEEAGLSRDDVYIANTVLCRPPKNRDPRKPELTACRPRLDEQIRLLAPRVVLSLGNFATKYILDTKEGITKLRGRVYDKDGMRIIPMQHPAVLLYHGNKPEKRREFLDDLNLVKEELKK